MSTQLCLSFLLHVQQNRLSSLSSSTKRTAFPSISRTNCLQKHSTHLPEVVVMMQHFSNKTKNMKNFLLLSTSSQSNWVLWLHLKDLRFHASTSKRRSTTQLESKRRHASVLPMLGTKQAPSSCEEYTWMRNSWFTPNGKAKSSWSTS